MKESNFKFLFAKRNIQSNKKSSIVVILTLSLIFCLTIMLVGLKSTSLKIYELEAIDNYKNIDIVISYDEYSSSRLINKRNIEETYGSDINYALSFFNLNVLYDNDTPIYLNMMSSVDYEFELLMNKDVLLLDDEVIITKSLSEKYNLSIGDTFNFSIMNNDFNYKVGDIFEDSNQFSGDTFYIDKAILMEIFYGLNLPNLGNVVYLDVSSTDNIDNLYNSLQIDENYDDYNIIKTIDWGYIETRANDFTSMFLAIGIIVIFAIFLVLDSLIPNVSKDLSKQLGVVSTLGGNKSFIWQVYIYQWTIYILVSFVFGSILSVIVNNLALSVYGIDGFIPFDPVVALISLLVIYIFLIIRARISFRYELNKTSVELSKGLRFRQYNVKLINIIVFTLIFLLEYIFNFLPIEYHALVLIVTSVYLCFNLMSLVLVYVTKIINRREKSLFSIFQSKYLQTNKSLHQSLRVIVISLLAVVMVFSFRVFMDNLIDDIEGMMTYDLAVTNVIDLDDSLIDELDDYDVSDLTKASLYNHSEMIINDNTEYCRYMISINYDELDNYFGKNIIDFDETYKNNEVVYVILADSFRLVYDLDVGDVILLNINYELESVPAYIAGFVDIDFDKVAYTNITEVEAYKDFAKHNTVFINTDNVDSLYPELIEDYSGRMYYVINPDIYFDSLISSSKGVLDFFAVFTLFIILCFVIVIFNNTLLVFNSLKLDLAKIKSLGADRKVFIKSIFKEYILISVLVIVFAVIESMILSDNLRYLVLFTNYYKNITATPYTIFIGCIIALLVEFLSYAYYFHKITNINVIKEIRI